MRFKKGFLELYARKWQAGPRRAKHPLGKPGCWNVLKPNFPAETLEVRLWLEEEEILLKRSSHSAFFSSAAGVSQRSMICLSGVILVVELGLGCPHILSMCLSKGMSSSYMGYQGSVLGEVYRHSC